MPFPRNVFVTAACIMVLSTPGYAAETQGRWSTMDAHLEAETQKGERAGYVVLVEAHGKIVHHKAIGFADIATERPMSLDTRFRLASMTKPITSAAAMILFERGKLLLSDPVDRYLPEFKDTKVVTGRNSDGSLKLEAPVRRMTILDLMLHTSGIGSRKAELNPEAAKLYAEILPAYYMQGTLEEKVRLLAKTPLWYQPGTQWGYGIYSTDVLGRVIEVVSGEPLDRFVQTQILEPLQMNDTGFLMRGRTVPNLASIYTHDDHGKLVKVEQHPLDQLTAAHGGGGMYSTAADYLKFLKFIESSREANRRNLLAPSSIAMMTRNALAPELMPIDLGIPLPGGGFAPGGYGVATDKAAMPHSPFVEHDYFWAGSTDPYFFVSPGRELVGIIMTQIQPNPKVTDWRTWDEFSAMAISAATVGDAR